MGDGSTQTRSNKRKQYLVDGPAQLRLILPLLAVLLGVGIAYALAIYLLPGGAALETLTADETRRLFLRANLVYYGLAAAGIGGVAILVTHRVIGPARVIEQAVRGLRSGDHDRRLALRPGDSLQSLALAVMELRDDLRHRAEDRRALSRELVSLLDAEDLIALRERLAQLEKPESQL